MITLLIRDSFEGVVLAVLIRVSADGVSHERDVTVHFNRLEVIHADRRSRDCGFALSERRRYRPNREGGRDENH